MEMTVKKMSLVDVILHRQGSSIVRLIHALFSIVTILFFRRIELFDFEKLPKHGGLIFVSNHQNALIDPLLLFVLIPRHVVFMAKSTLFKMPVIGYLIRAIGSLPLYRQQDKGQDVSKNAETFRLSRELLKKGGAIAIFPEGISHDAPRLMPLKTGAARIGLGAVSIGQNPLSLELKIVPIGLYYTNKTRFRSEALLYFGDPIDVFPTTLDEMGQPGKKAVNELTENIESALKQVTINAESERELEIAKVAEDVFTATTPHRENLAERREIIQRFLEEPESSEDAKLESQLTEYGKKLRKLGLESEFLALPEYSKRFIVKSALLKSWHLILLAPLAIFGLILHVPAYQICAILAYLETKKQNYDLESTVKIIAGLILIPLTWLIFALVINHYLSWQMALLSIPFSFVCGYIALRSIEEISELLGWLRAISFFFLKREKFLKLLAERRALFEKLNK